MSCYCYTLLRLHSLRQVLFHKVRQLQHLRIQSFLCRLYQTFSGNQKKAIRKFIENILDYISSQEKYRSVYSNLMNILEKAGVEVINRVGEEFDPNLEEALVTDCIEDKDDDIVIEVLSKGYKLKGRVIRPAAVKINQK